MNLYLIPNTPVDIDGITHLHTVVGPVAENATGLLRWSGFNSKKPIECFRCINMIDVYHEELCRKYGWMEWPL